MNHEIEQLEKEIATLNERLLKGSVELETLRNENEQLKWQLENADSRADQALSRAAELKQKDERSTLVIETLFGHLKNFLDEKESEFYRTKQFESPEICISYIEAAKYAINFGRTENMIKDAKAWLDVKTPDPDQHSDTLFDQFKGLKFI